jgi:hypothetical protein
MVKLDIIFDLIYWPLNIKRTLCLVVFKLSTLVQSIQTKYTGTIYRINHPYQFRGQRSRVKLDTEIYWPFNILRNLCLTDIKFDKLVYIWMSSRYWEDSIFLSPMLIYLDLWPIDLKWKVLMIYYRADIVWSTDRPIDRCRTICLCSLKEGMKIIPELEW